MGAGANRPAYWEDATQEAVNCWIEQALAMRIKAIICLLSRKELEEYYLSRGIDLLQLYGQNGITICHIPADDHRNPPLGPGQVLKLRAAFTQLPYPLLVHCSAGVDRTGMAVEVFQRLHRSRRKNNFRKNDQYESE